MRRRYLVSLSALVGVVGLVSLVVSVPGQTPATPSKQPAKQPTASKSTAAAKAGAPLRTPWGDPDLQGTWFVMADVPLERSATNAGKEFLTDDEVAAADKQKGLNPGAIPARPMPPKTSTAPITQSSTQSCGPASARP